MRGKSSLVREMIFNEQMVDVARVETALEDKGQREAFEALLRRAQPVARRVVSCERSRQLCPRALHPAQPAGHTGIQRRTRPHAPHRLAGDCGAEHGRPLGHLLEPAQGPRRADGLSSDEILRADKK
jgi:hypothetical protein